MTPTEHTITREQLLILLRACLNEESTLTLSKREILRHEACQLGWDDATADILSSKVLKLWNALGIVIDKFIEINKVI